MKKILLAVVVLSMVSGCATTSLNDMMNNTFLAKTTINNDIDGTWTGAYGPSIITFVIEENGTGNACAVGLGNTVATVHRTKIYNLKNGVYSMVTEIGTIHTLNKERKTLILKTYNMESKLQLDTQLELANPLCKESLM